METQLNDTELDTNDEATSHTSNTDVTNDHQDENEHDGVSNVCVPSLGQPHPYMLYKSLQICGHEYDKKQA